MEQLAQLVREVERLVTAPYVPSLHGLYDLLEQGCSSSIDSWAYCKPCQVGLLADVLVEALPRSRVALPLIAAFAKSSAVRDALLERHPVILDALLEKAVNGESEYYSACIAFFYSPLPEGFVPPARIATFVSKLVSVMVANPCAETVAPIHALIAGLKGSPRFLDDIPSEIMSNLQLELTKTLRNLDDHVGNLRCLATFAHIATSRSTSSQHQHGSESQWLTNIKHFFGLKRGIKTLDLVVLRVILACSSSCTLGPQDATESIRLAIVIADAIEPEQKQAWIASNSSKLSKLCEKAVRDGLYDGIQKMAIVFLHALLPAQSLSTQLREFGLKTLLSEDSQGTLELVSPQLITRLAKSLAATGESAARETMNFVVGTLKGSQWKTRESITALRLAQSILAGLQQADRETMSFNLNSSKIAIGQVLGETMEQFPRQPSESQCTESLVCTAQLCIMQNQLYLSLLRIYNTVSSVQTGGDVIMECFLKRVEHNLPNTCCAFSGSTRGNFRGGLALPDNSKLSSTHINRNWRAGVTDTFMQNAQSSHDSMMRKIEDTCFDLERRCDDVEGPLRVVEEERNRCAQENEQLKEHNQQLNEELKQKSDQVEAARRESSEHLTEFGHEHTRLEQLLQDQYTHRDELIMSIDSLRVELQEHQRSSESAIVSEREKARSKELEMMATLTEKEDQIEELQEQLGSERSLNEQKSQTLAQISKENANLQEISSSLELELAGATQSLEQVRLLNDQKDETISDLSGLNSHKEEQIQRLQSQEERLRDELGSLEASVAQHCAEQERLNDVLQQSEEKWRGEIERLNSEAEAEASRAKTEIVKQTEETQRLQAAMQAASHNAANDAQSKLKRIQHLERKVQALRDERAAKAREFSEAQQHIGRLMGVMGFSANAPDPAQTQRGKPSHQTPARHPQPTSDEDEDEDETQPESSQYLATGPTPKRPRANRKSAPYPTSSSSANPRRSPPRSVRKPLADTVGNSPNKTPSSSGSKHSQVEALPGTPAQETYGENRLQNLDLDMDLEFSKDFLFSSTAFTGSNEQTDMQ